MITEDFQCRSKAEDLFELVRIEDIQEVAAGLESFSYL